MTHGLDDQAVRQATRELVVGVPALAGVFSLTAVLVLLVPSLGAARGWHAGAWAGVAAAAGALLVEVPALHWAMANGRSRLVVWLGLGAAAGAVPIAIPFVGHLIGAMVRGYVADIDMTFPIVLRMILYAIGLADLRPRMSMMAIELFPVVIGALASAVFRWRFLHLTRGG